MTEPSGLLTLSPGQAATLIAVFERLFPAGETGPGASAIGAHIYVDRALAGAYREHLETYRLGLAALDRAAQLVGGSSFAACAPERQDDLLDQLARGNLQDFAVPPQEEFFVLLRAHLQEGLFADPVHGGNRDKAGWKFLQHPGIWLENEAGEEVSGEPALKGGVIRSLADVRHPLPDARCTVPVVPGYDSPASAAPPVADADVVIVGVGAAGSLAARVLGRAGLRVVGLEAGPWRSIQDYVPDELTSAYYCRGDMGPKFLAETPRWRRDEGGATREATFSLGRMMNGVGGSVVHWGGVLRRFHPHHFRYLTHVRAAFGEGVLPEGHTLADWPLTYAELEPYYAELERLIGVAGDAAANPFIPRSGPLPLPPLRPYTGGRLFQKGATDLGLHPYPTPVAVNSIPYNGGPESAYCAWMGGFGPFRNDRWTPSMTWVPEALATGNVTLRTHARVVRVLTDGSGRARGVEYVAADGQARVQTARTVILAGYTFENVRLLLLGGDGMHPRGLGNNGGQVGKHFMTKPWADTHGYFPQVVFNAHTGPAAQMWGLDDYIAEGFDAASRGFVGGVTPSAENQRLPIQISREHLPPGVPRWGSDYKAHIRNWQHFFAVRLQPSALSYHTNYLDLDPHYRDRSRLGLPVVRITYDLRENERRLYRWMEDRGEELLRAMGAAEAWRSPGFHGVCSSHDVGGCRMGEDPAGSVVDRDLAVHDTPGLYVFSGAAFPSCPAVNPTLTMWAVCYRAAEHLVERLRRS